MQFVLIYSCFVLLSCFVIFNSFNVIPTKIKYILMRELFLVRVLVWEPLVI